MASMWDRLSELFSKGKARGQRRGKTSRIRPLRFVPRCELLEDRTLPATFLVTNLLDNGSVGSLRWAVGQANALA